MRKHRPGFTLVEVIVAILVIAIALLALVDGTAVLVRQANELKTRTTAVRAALNRLQMLGAGPCAEATGVAVGSGPIREQWSVTVHAHAMREVRDTVVFGLPRRGGSLLLVTRFPC